MIFVSKWPKAGRQAGFLMFSEEHEVKKKSKLRKILLILSALLFALAAALAVYAGDYYHAGDTSAELLENGTDTVKISEGKNGELIFAPADDSDPDTGFIFYPGGKVEYSAYAPLMEKIAEKGILCVIVKMPCNLAILDTGAADEIPEEFPEITDWYIGGHSLGGASASMYLEGNSEKYRGLVLLGAYSSVDLTETGLSVLSVYGSNDGVMKRDKYSEYLNNLPSDFTEYIIEGGCHSYFGDYGAQKGDGTPSVTAEEQWTITADVISDWIKNHKN